MKFIILLAIAAVASAQTCSQDTDCKGLTFPGATEWRDNAMRNTQYNGKCCIGGSPYSNYCYIPDYQICGSNPSSDHYYPENNVCNKHGDFSCGNSCCDKFTQVCQKYAELNGRKVATCVHKMTENEGVWILAVPIILGLFSLALFVIAILMVLKVLNQFELFEKVLCLLTLVLIFLAQLFYYSPAWGYGIAIVVGGVMGLITLGTDTRGKWLGFFVYVVLLFVVLGYYPGSNRGNISGGLQNSIDCTSDYSAYFARTSDTSYKWTDDNAALRAGRDPSLRNRNWGYCDPGWVVTLRVIGLIELIIICVLLIGHMKLLVGAGNVPLPGKE